LLKMKRIKLLLGVAATSVFLTTQVHSALLVGWYRFNDPSNLGLDSSGLGNDGTVIDNGAAPIYSAGTGITGGAADFRGGGKINIPFNTGPALWPDLTWGGWVNPDLVDNIRTLLNNDDGGYDRALNIDWRAGGNYAAFVNNGPSPYSSGVAPTVGQWTFLAGVYENNYYGVGQGRLTMYVGNQVFENIRTYYGNTGWTFTSIGGSPTFGEFWDGLMDDVFVIGGAATQSQMLQIMNNPNDLAAIAASVGVPEPGQVAASLLLLGGIGGYVLLKRRRAAKPALAQTPA
jgi:hypothetical protein